MNIKQVSPLVIGVLLGIASIRGFAGEPQAPIGEVSQVAVQEAGVNLNTATADVIAAQLIGVGPAKAKAIVEFRDLNGPFLQLEELTQVKGIGLSTVEKNKDVIRLN